MEFLWGGKRKKTGLQQNYIMFNEDPKARYAISEVHSAADCTVCPILTENSLITYKFRLCLYFHFKIWLSQHNEVKPPQAFLHFILKLITQEIGIFCGKADNCFPCEVLSQSVFSAKDKTNIWVTRHIPSFKYFQVVICLCTLLWIWLYEFYRWAGIGRGEWQISRVRTEIERNYHLGAQAEMDMCFSL